MDRDRQPPCRHLRTKAVYVSDEQGREYLERTIPSESYWCVKTMRPVGPDDEPAEPDDCGRNRPCYQPLAEDGTVAIRTTSSTSRA